MDYHSNKPRTKIKQRLHKPASRSEQSLANDPIKLTEAWRSATGCEPTCLLMRRCVKKASRYGNAQKQRANKCSRTAQAKGKKDDVRKANMVTSRARFNHIWRTTAGQYAVGGRVWVKEKSLKCQTRDRLLIDASTHTHSSIPPVRARRSTGAIAEAQLRWSRRETPSSASRRHGKNAIRSLIWRIQFTRALLLFRHKTAFLCPCRSKEQGAFHWNHALWCRIRYRRRSVRSKWKTSTDYLKNEKTIKVLYRILHRK